MAEKPEKKWGKVVEKSWEQVQQKAFTHWVNTVIEKRNMKIEDITEDLSDGVVLINFLELLSGKKLGQKWDSDPSFVIQKIQNLHMALVFLEKEMEVRLVGIGAEDFVEKNRKLILGFLWSLFRKYKIATIKSGDKSSEEGLLLWCKKVTEGYKGVDVRDYGHSFRDGMALLAMVDRYKPGLFDYNSFLDKTEDQRLQAAFDFAETEIGVPKLLDMEEVKSGTVDERGLVLYISLFFHAFMALSEKAKLEAGQREVQSKLESVEEQLERERREREELERSKKEMEGDLHLKYEQLRAEMEKLRKENEELKRERADLKEKDTYLEEKVEVLKQLLEQENDEKEELGNEKTKLEQTLKEREDAIRKLKERMARETEEKDGSASKLDAHKKRAEVEFRGLEVLRKNLDEHIEDVFKWRKYLDLEDGGTGDWDSEVKSMEKDLDKAGFDEQLKYLTGKLDDEHTRMAKLLKQKAIDFNAKAANSKKAAPKARS